MNLELSEEQEQLAEGLRELLVGSGDIARVRRFAYDGEDRDGELWEQLVTNGWTTASILEKAGGLGLGFEEAMVIAIESGRGVLHLPLCETLLATRVAGRASNEAGDGLVEKIAEGAGVTLAVGASAGGLNDADDGVQADENGQLTGSLRSVPFGPVAAHCLVEATFPGGQTGLFVVSCEATGVQWRMRQAMDESVPRFDLELRGAASESLFGHTEARDEVERLTDEWRVLLGAQTEGACRRLVEMTADYVKKREQFGRPVGSNQAVKVRVAEMGAAVEKMRAAIYFAALSIEQETEERSLAVAMAKAETGTPGAFVATQAIHTHGAIGYTWEQDVHLFVKRVKSNELLLGAGHEMLGHIADILLDGSP
ncbi:acyl-CoA/acyl-ACP dehydrogenase [Myxococcota bacterium]|nr:acyl-CoA/acyl-ACP dehydrogenase [Myxococcota bacterium]